jgi:non-ribosomal peptide synthetase component E (peptide arylation enzyme)
MFFQELVREHAARWVFSSYGVPDRIIFVVLDRTSGGKVEGKSLRKKRVETFSPAPT